MCVCSKGNEGRCVCDVLTAMAVFVFYFGRCCLSEVHKTLPDDYHHWTSHENSFLCDLDLFSRPQNSLQRLVTVSHIFRFEKIQLGICWFCFKWQRALCLQSFYSFHLHTSIDCRHVCLLPPPPPPPPPHPPFSASHCLLCSEEFIFMAAMAIGVSSCF